MMMRFKILSHICSKKMKRKSTSGKHYLYSRSEYCQPVTKHIIAISHYHYSLYTFGVIFLFL